MINRRFYIVLIFLFSVANTRAQETRSFSSSVGKWTFALYDGNITKSTLGPINYLHNEQISNAFKNCYAGILAIDIHQVVLSEIYIEIFAL